MMQHPPSSNRKFVLTCLLAACVGGAFGGGATVGCGLVRPFAPGAFAGLVGTLAFGVVAGLLSRDTRALLWGGILGGCAGHSGSPLAALEVGLAMGCVAVCFSPALRPTHRRPEGDEAKSQ